MHRLDESEINKMWGKGQGRERERGRAREADIFDEMNFAV